MSDILVRERRTYDEMRAEIERHHMSKFVVIRGSELVGAFDTLENAAKAAKGRFGKGPYLIRQVGARDLVHLPASVLFRPMAEHADR